MRDVDTPAKAFARMQPDILVIAGGASPVQGSFDELSWEDFSLVWETDTKATFGFFKAAISVPLKAGSKALVLSSGAGLGGSPVSGGYAGAKRMQMFLANYGQNESDNRGLGINFTSLVIKQIMAETGLGQAAAEAYAKRGGITVEQFMARFKPYITPVDVATAAMEILGSSKIESATGYAVSGQGLEAL
jgi:NAD(P)-dependent dehydrogenase (short-subunit alcohol dehydrogenase family)